VANALIEPVDHVDRTVRTQRQMARAPEPSPGARSGISVAIEYRIGLGAVVSQQPADHPDRMEWILDASGRTPRDGVDRSEVHASVRGNCHTPRLVQELLIVVTGKVRRPDQRRQPLGGQFLNRLTLRFEGGPVTLI